MGRHNHFGLVIMIQYVEISTRVIKEPYNLSIFKVIHTETSLKLSWDEN